MVSDLILRFAVLSLSTKHLTPRHLRVLPFSTVNVPCSRSTRLVRSSLRLLSFVFCVAFPTARLDTFLFPRPLALYLLLGLFLTAHMYVGRIYSLSRLSGWCSILLSVEQAAFPLPSWAYAFAILKIVQIVECKDVSHSMWATHNPQVAFRFVDYIPVILLLVVCLPSSSNQHGYRYYIVSNCNTTSRSWGSLRLFRSSTSLSRIWHRIISSRTCWYSMSLTLYIHLVPGPSN